VARVYRGRHAHSTPSPICAVILVCALPIHPMPSMPSILGCSWYRWLCRYVYVPCGGGVSALVATMAVSTVLHGASRLVVGLVQSERVVLCGRCMGMQLLTAQA